MHTTDSHKKGKKLEGQVDTRKGVSSKNVFILKLKCKHFQSEGSLICKLLLYRL